MKERLDKVMTDRQLAGTRSQAKVLIEKGDVSVGSEVVTKAGTLVDPSSEISVKAALYVGRGAFKLKRAMEEFKIDVSEKVILDVGASTGGFTEILLERGAKKVYAIDVGRDQLASKLRNDERVVNLEGTNIKELSSLPELASGAVMDLSFISITKVADKVRELLMSGGFLIALVKPQFEVGPERLPKDGVVKDEKLRARVLAEVVAALVDSGWTHLRTILSPIEGKSGNVEYLTHFTRD